MFLGAGQKSERKKIRSYRFTIGSVSRIEVRPVSFSAIGCYSEPFLVRRVRFSERESVMYEYGPLAASGSRRGREFSEE
jgi:hypothetical protein